MHRIDAPGATLDNKFTEGNPQTGVEATRVGSDWLNAVQEEVVSVITAAGIALDKSKDDQLLAAVHRLVRIAHPIGQVIWGYWSAAPDGALKASGQLISRVTYEALFEFATAAGIVVSEAEWAAGKHTQFGAGDGVTTFRLPRLGGEFLRSLDDGAGVDGGRALGSWQDYATARPKTTTPSQVRGDGSTGSMTGASNPSHLGFARASRAGEAVTAGSSDASGSGTQIDVLNAVSGDAETRPRNVALLACIYY